MIQFDITTRVKASDFSGEYSGNEFNDPMREAFKRGRESAKESLAILARAIQFALIYDPDTDRYKIKHTAYPKLKEAIAEVKARGDWPLEGK